MLDKKNFFNNKSSFLLVDSDKKFLAAVSDALRSFHYDVEMVFSNQQAEDKLQKSFDVVIVNIVPGDETGLNIISKFKKSDPLTVCIVTTAFPEIDTAIKAIKIGASDYLCKPFEVDELLISLEKSIEKLYLQRGKIAAELILKERNVELQGSIDKGRKVLSQAINSLALLFGNNESYFEGHHEGVAKLASAIAREMDFSEQRVEGMRIAGILHDIGKVGVPLEILSKPSKISSAEYNLIKIHSQIGYDILKEVDFEWPVAKIVLQHHKMINGAGYPDNVKKGELLIESKILAVADVVEALLSDRPYRKAFDVSFAMRKLREQSGILYDSHVVGACIKLFENDFTFVSN